MGGGQILEDKNEKIAENEQSARVNRITVMLKSLFHTQKGIPMNSRPVEMGHQNRWTLGVCNCTTECNAPSPQKCQK